MPLDPDIRRISTAFRRAMLVVIAGGGACSTQSPEVAKWVDAGSDAGVASEASTDAAAEMPDAACEGQAFFPDPPDNCGDYVKFPCGLPPGIAPRGDCFFPLGDCASMCPGVQFNCRAIETYCLDGGVVVPDDAGAIIVDCSRCAGSVGRLPAGLEPRLETREMAATPSDGLGDYFAEVAHLEAASVFAFRIFGRELETFGAPPELVLEARRAEADEVRHAKIMGRLARRFGGRFSRPRVREPLARDLEAFARDNAVEGCVRETFGALVATWQAAHANDPEVARALAVIAEDETRHAALSHATFRWAFERLDTEARARVERARSEAIDMLIDPPGTNDRLPCEQLVAVAGLPPRTIQRRLARTLRRDLWAAPAFLEAS